MALSQIRPLEVRLLIHTRFYPSAGGIETVASLVAHAWARSNVSVSIVTDVLPPGVNETAFPFAVHYRPSGPKFLRLVWTHDVFVHFNISLRALWPLLLVRRPLVAVHHGCYVINRAGQRDWREQLKLQIARRAATNIAASHTIARAVGIDCDVIPNPYDPSLFYDGGEKLRSRELIFVGRLVSDKGVGMFLDSLQILKQHFLRPSVTIVGDGPERIALEAAVRRLDLGEQVTFTGAKTQREVADLLRRHKILVVPSLWEEPFGVVALEGIASGCLVVGSQGGGLPEAIGPCGLTFQNGDVQGLAEKLELGLRDRSLADKLQSQAAQHLERHHPDGVAARYLTVIQKAMRRA